MFSRIVAALVALAALSSGASGQEGKFEPIPEAVSRFLQQQFDTVPAPGISERIPRTTCRKDEFPEPFQGVGGADVLGAYFCMIDYGCDRVDGVPVWFDANGTLWFGPDNAGRLVAMYCEESISDPERRKALTDEVFQGG